MQYNKEQWIAAKKAGVKTISGFIKFLKQGAKMTNTELKAYIKSKLSFEDEKVLEKVLENSLFGTTKTDNIYSLEKNIEKVVDSSSRGKVKDYFLVLDENTDKREFHLQGYIETK